MRCVWLVNVQLFAAATADVLPCGSGVAWHCCRCMVTHLTFVSATSAMLPSCTCSFSHTPALAHALALSHTLLRLLFLAHLLLRLLMQVRERYLPTTIRGDLDSVRPEVLAFYRQRGVLVEDLSGAGQAAVACVQPNHLQTLSHVAANHRLRVSGNSLLRLPSLCR